MRLAARQKASTVTPLRPGCTLRSFGYQWSQKGRLRATMFSHSRDCDSWMAMEMAPPSGVRARLGESPCSYRPWPASWMAPNRPPARSAGS